MESNKYKILKNQCGWEFRCRRDDKLNFFVLCGLCVSQFQPQASLTANNGYLKKLFKCPALRAIFVSKCQAPCSCYDGQMPGPSPSYQYKKILVAIFLINITFSAQMKWLKIGHERVTATERQSKIIDGFIAFIGLLRLIQVNTLFIQNDIV